MARLSQDLTSNENILSYHNLDFFYSPSSPNNQNTISLSVHHCFLVHLLCDRLCNKLKNLCVNICNIRNNKSVINERRHKLFALLTRGMKGYEIAKELNVDYATVSRDIKYLTAESQNYLNSLAKETMPFMFQTSISGITDILKECWNIYESTDNNFQRLAAFKLAKECHEAVFKLVDEGPSVMYLKQLQEKLLQIESRQIR